MQAEKLMERLGKLTREFIAGTIDCLQVRAIQKAQLKQSNTAANPDEINPLESAATFDEGFMQLVLMDSKGSRSPAESVHDAFARLAAHERTLLAALRDALDDYLERLDPETIERGVGSRKMGALMGAANKHRYWDLYKDVYAILGNRPVDELPQAFLEELARAYERNLVKAETVVDREPGIVVG
jgi:type VI secretion system FHA domain protein